MKHLKYMSYILRHKWYVFVECCKLGIPWRGLVHDLSKLLPSEWAPYVAKFYGPKLPPEEAYLVCMGFDLAWLHHQHRNPHHWQHWILLEDSGESKIMEMPEVYVREMVADWRGAGMAIHGTSDKQELVKWYAMTKPSRRLHPNTLRRVEELLEGMA